MELQVYFLDESEAKIVFDDGNYNKYDIDEIVITNGSDGSRRYCWRVMKLRSEAVES